MNVNNQITMFSLRPVFKASLALLIFLAPSASVVVAQQDDKNVTLMTSDDNNTTDSSSRLMTNYNALREEGQGFFLVDYPLLLETPESVLIPGVLLAWWCDFEFSSEDANTTNYGYVGRGVGYYLGSTLDDTVAQDPQNPKKKGILFRFRLRFRFRRCWCRRWVSLKDNGIPPTMIWSGGIGMMAVPPFRFLGGKATMKRIFIPMRIRVRGRG